MGGGFTYLSMTVGGYIKHTIITFIAGAATGFIVAAAASQLNGTDITTEMLKQASEKKEIADG